MTLMENGEGSVMCVKLLMVLKGVLKLDVHARLSHREF